MTALNCLVRNANTYIIHGNSLSLEAWGGYAVRRTPFGGELHRLTTEQAKTLIEAPFKKPDTTTALTPNAPTVGEPAPDTRAALDQVAQSFPTNKKGQIDFGF